MLPHSHSQAGVIIDAGHLLLWRAGNTTGQPRGGAQDEVSHVAASGSMSSRCSRPPGPTAGAGGPRALPGPRAAAGTGAGGAGL